MKKAIIICLAAVVFLIPAFVFASSCDDGTKAVDPTEADIQKFVEVLSVFEFVFGGEVPPPCVDLSESSPYSPEGGTITFTDCDIEGVIVNGSVNMKMAYDEPIFSITLSGSLTFAGAGAPVSSISFDFTMTVDTTSSPYSIAMSGTITIDGTVFNASGFLDEFYYFFYYIY